MVIDRDFVELTNLQRQMLYTEEDVGKAKAIAACEHLQKINREVKIEACVADVHAENVDELLKEVDIILDGTDNLETRFLLNEYSLKHHIPWVYGGAIQDRGFVMAFTGGQPCFQCVVNEAEGLETCDTVGVLNSVTTLIGSLQVSEATKVLLGKPAGGLIHVQVMSNRFDVLRVKPNPSCQACQGIYDYLEGRKGKQIVRFCRTGQFQVFSQRPLDLVALKGRLQRAGKVEDLGFCLVFEGMKIFRDRALIPAKTEQEAKAAYAKVIGN